MINSKTRWSRHDWFYLWILLGLGCLTMLPGLSIRSLWGSEGRWAVIAREMFESGNYFMPTINGMLYFDKPLLSYWAIIPFSLKGGVTEITARLPSAIAGISACIIVFFIGRRLFDSKTGFISGLLLLTTSMFLFWARHASADMLNLLFIWLMFWFFVTGGMEGYFINLIAIYLTGAIASFLKGPVGPSVVIFSMGFYSLISMFLNLGKEKFSYNILKEEFLRQFRWILSWRGLAAITIGAVMFLILLFLPVWVTGSWESVRLMWRENIERFFKPFDHVEPAYAYIKHIAVFTAPWTLLIVASLFKARGLWKERSVRFITLLSLGILIFFLFSGSRRSYYILPLIPGLVIVSGRVIRGWLDGYTSHILKMAFVLTAVLVSLSGVALLYVYLNMDELSHISQVILAPFILFFGILSVYYFFKGKFIKGFIFLFLIVFSMELWVFNIGMAVTEKQRGSLKLFSLRAKETIKQMGNEKVVIFRDVPSSIIFYLNMGRIKEIQTREDLMEFRKSNPDGMVIADMKNLDGLYDSKDDIWFETLIEEKKKDGKDERLALLRFK